MLAAQIVSIVGQLRKDYRTIVGAVLSIISGNDHHPASTRHTIKLFLYFSCSNYLLN